MPCCGLSKRFGIICDFVLIDQLNQLSLTGRQPCFHNYTERSVSFVKQRANMACLKSVCQQLSVPYSRYAISRNCIQKPVHRVTNAIRYRRFVYAPCNVRSTSSVVGIVHATHVVRGGTAMTSYIGHNSTAGYMQSQFVQQR